MHLALQLPGTPQFQLDDVPVTASRRAGVALIAYLTVTDFEHPGRRSSRESLPGTCRSPWAAPTSLLRLPISILWELKHQGYFQVSQLIKARTIGYSSALWLNAKDIEEEVDRAFNDYPGRAAQGRLLTYVGIESILEPPSIPSPFLQLHSEDVWSARLAGAGRNAGRSDT